VEFTYAVNVTTSAGNPPSFIYNQPGTTTPAANPIPRDAAITANGTATQVIEFGVLNHIWSSLTGPYQMQNFEMNINRTFSESGLNQDVAGGCRVSVTFGSTNHTIRLADDQGLWTLPAINFNTQSGTGGSASNSQCTVQMEPPQSYLYAPYGYNNYLFVGIKFTFKPAFQGARYLFMKANRLQGDSTVNPPPDPPTAVVTGWQYRSLYTMQP
jgi:hypothetical protein